MLLSRECCGASGAVLSTEGRARQEAWAMIRFAAISPTQYFGNILNVKDFAACLASSLLDPIFVSPTDLRVRVT